MSLPAPRLDDRSFQQLVDEAKVYVQQRCPGWTDHNVSDPGVTLIETFAWMTDMLLYRVNRVPDRLHLRFLELVGVTLFPPRAARTEMTFRLSSHQDSALVIPAGTAVSTRRTVQEQSVGFTTAADLVIPPARSHVVGALDAAGTWTDLTPRLGVGVTHRVFGAVPEVDDALHVGLDAPAPRGLLLVQVVCTVGGHGIDPRTPPLVWEAWTLHGWRPCEVQRDDTAGLNVSGGIELHLPDGHAESDMWGVRAAWVRCRVVSAPLMYRSSPEVSSLTAAVIGGDVDAVAAEAVGPERLGTSDGTSGQRFHLAHPPVLPDVDAPLTVEVRRPEVPDDEGGPPLVVGEAWAVVEDFAGSGPESRHAVLDRTTGELRFGPAVRHEDGSVRQHGAVPPRGATVGVGGYRTGGGTAGNVAAGTVTVLRSSIPYVAAVYNRRPATGGVQGEDVEEARVRGPLELRRRSRAVTVEDYVTITRDAAPELARVHCVPVPEEPGAVRVLVVPAVTARDGRVALAELRPPDGARARVVSALEAARVIGARVSVEPPSYVGVRVDARVRAHRDTDATTVERRATRALFDYFNPITGGPGGGGWPFGRPVQAGEVHAVLGRVKGLDYVEEVVLFRASPLDGSVSAPQERIDLAPTHLVVSVEHTVHVEAGP